MQFFVRETRTLFLSDKPVDKADREARWMVEEAAEFIEGLFRYVRNWTDAPVTEVLRYTADNLVDAHDLFADCVRLVELTGAGSLPNREPLVPSRRQIMIRAVVKHMETEIPGFMFVEAPGDSEEAIDEQVTYGTTEYHLALWLLEQDYDRQVRLRRYAAHAGPCPLSSDSGDDSVDKIVWTYMELSRWGYLDLPYDADLGRLRARRGFPTLGDVRIESEYAEGWTFARQRIRELDDRGRRRLFLIAEELGLPRGLFIGLLHPDLMGAGIDAKTSRQMSNEVVAEVAGKFHRDPVRYMWWPFTGYLWPPTAAVDAQVEKRDGDPTSEAGSIAAYAGAVDVQQAFARIRHVIGMVWFATTGFQYAEQSSAEYIRINTQITASLQKSVRLHQRHIHTAHRHIAALRAWSRRCREGDRVPLWTVVDGESEPRQTIRDAQLFVNKAMVVVALSRASHFRSLFVWANEEAAKIKLS
ncbi:hypothetical protein GGR56DRAFT_658157, partial [Xylariaceae sp. FL0804]